MESRCGVVFSYVIEEFNSSVKENRKIAKEVVENGIFVWKYKKFNLAK